MTRLCALILALFAVLIVPMGAAAQGDFTLPPGYRAELVASGFAMPTHVTIGPDGLLYVSQLNGPEDAGTGQVIRVGADGRLAVVLESLRRPTGITFAADGLYIAAGNNLLRSALSPDGTFAPPQPVIEAVPFNGRSLGQIFTGPDGRVYFQSTGDENQPERSGQVRVYDPVEGRQSVFARGVRNAHALAWNPASGLMYATEIAEPPRVGMAAPPEELNVIRRGGDYGWPLCYANQREHREIGGNRNICADTDPSLATFPPRSVPTGLAFFEGRLIVALSNGSPPRLVAVDPKNGEVSPFAAGFQRPIALLTSPDGAALYVLDMDGGALYRVFRP